jgi:hypothetical protein
MDIFVFPSQTDTFGNVILEALASGVPAVVTADGGPKFLVASGETGFVARDEAGFLECILRLADDPGLRHDMGNAGRQHALRQSWDQIFEDVYSAYGGLLEGRSGDTWNIHDKALSRKNTLLPALDGRVFRSADLGPRRNATICRLRPDITRVHVSRAVVCAEPAGPDIHLQERVGTVRED